MVAETMFILEPPYIYFILVAVVVGIGLAIFKKVKMSNKEEGFKGKTIREVVVNKNLKPYMNIMSKRIKNGLLINGMNTINITKFVEINVESNMLPTDKNKKSLDKISLIAFQTGKRFKIPIISKLSSNDEYFLLENHEDVIIKDPINNVWTLNKNVHLYMLAGVWVSGEDAKHYVSEMIFKEIFEDLKEEDMNYPKRLVAYNDRYAFNMTAVEQEYDLEDRKWDRRAEGETGSRNPRSNVKK